jgi:acetolactate synthase-1/2/3 large subunit
LRTTQLVRSITRYAPSASLVLQELDEAIRRRLSGEPGPSYIVPDDTLRGIVPKALQLEEHLNPKPRTITRPDPAQVQKAVDLLWSARRVLVISGRGARGAGPELISLLDRLGAVYLDTGESRGLVPDSHPSVVGAMRGAVMGDADVVLTVGRRLDFQLAYGSPAVFQSTKFVRISDALGDGTTGAARWRFCFSAETLRAWSNMPEIGCPKWTGNGPRNCAAVMKNAPGSCSKPWPRRLTVPTAGCTRTRCYRPFRRRLAMIPL